MYKHSFMKLTQKTHIFYKIKYSMDSSIKFCFLFQIFFESISIYWYLRIHFYKIQKIWKNHIMLVNVKIFEEYLGAFCV